MTLTNNKTVLKGDYNMVFTEAREGCGWTHLDGYSKAKTVKGAYKDLMREVAKISESEGNIPYEYNEGLINAGSHDGYMIEIDEVSCASKLSKEEEIEYKEANFYCFIRFLA